jgi:hypothetical protein
MGGQTERSSISNFHKNWGPFRLSQVSGEKSGGTAETFQLLASLSFKALPVAL